MEEASVPEGPSGETASEGARERERAEGEEREGGAGEGEPAMCPNLRASHFSTC